MRAITKNLLAVSYTMTLVTFNGVALVGFNATGAFADDVDYGTNRNESKNIETKAQHDIATKFNVHAEDIDCETIFSKPSFGKAYHKSGSVQEYCGAIKPDVLPDYQLRRTDYQNDSEHPLWSMGDIGILCSLLLVLVLIILGRSLLFRNDSKSNFKHWNEV